MRSQLESSDPTLAQTLIENAQEVIDALNNPAGSNPVRSNLLSREANGKVRVQFSAVTGKSQIVAASTNLVDWELIGVAVDRGNGTFEFEDGGAGHFFTRFYRIVSP